jgi:hypothetical protein
MVFGQFVYVHRACVGHYQAVSGGSLPTEHAERLQRISESDHLDARRLAVYWPTYPGET